MKTLWLILGVLILAVAAAISGQFAKEKQRGVFPPGAYEVAAGTVHGQTAALPEAAQDSAVSLNSGQPLPMPQSDVPYGPDNKLVIAGCLVQQKGDWVLLRQNQPTFLLSGDIPDSQANKSHWIQVSGYAKQAQNEATNNAGGKTSQPGHAIFVVENLDQVGPGCNQQLPFTVAVPGKTGAHGSDIPITTTDSAQTPTSGTQTGTGRDQAPGVQIGPPEQQTPPPKQPSVVEGAPPNLNRAGEDPFSAERSSQGVRRAQEAADYATGEANSGKQGAKQNQKQGETKQQGNSGSNPR